MLAPQVHEPVAARATYRVTVERPANQRPLSEKA
jgi:hypothetical protein